MTSLGHYVYSKITDMFSDSTLSETSESGNPIRRGEYDNGYYHPSTVDVLTVKDVLCELPKHDLLPLELVDTIIDHAEYWPRTVSKTTKEVRVNGSPRRPEAEESSFVLRTLPIGYYEEGSSLDGAYFTTKPQPWQESTQGPPNMTNKLLEHWQSRYSWRGKNVCRKVVFNIKSHDQGWGGERGTHKSYKNSWTWLDVGVETLRVYEEDASAQNASHQSKSSLSDTDTEFNPLRFRKFNTNSLNDNTINSLRTVLPTTVLTPTSSNMHIPNPSQPFSFQHPLLPSSLCLQKNLVSYRTTQNNIITWRCTDQTHPASQEGDDLEANGRGRKTLDGDFVRGLQAGDCVTVWAKARFPGWSCVVESVSVEVFWAV